MVDDGRKVLGAPEVTTVDAPEGETVGAPEGKQ